MMNTATPRKERVTLQLASRIRLASLVQDEYHASGKSDGDFAALATERIGVPVVASHVQYVRAQLGMKSNHDLKREALLTRPAAGTDELEARVNELEGRMRIMQAALAEVLKTLGHPQQLQLASALAANG